MEFNFNTQDTMLSSSSIDRHFATTKKTFDPIHGYIEFDSDIWKIIDTPEFQRLRDIKQLGASSFVFPGANHPRFEHCLGTGHLSQKLIRGIFKQQPSILEEFDSEEYSNQIKKNVTLAGVLHDLGHGPFSHLFDGKIIKKLCPEANWTHEQGSDMLFRKLVEDNNIDLEQSDVNMIGDLILGKREGYAGKRWIFDIVANDRNSIDVDKYDYMTRDSYHLGLKDTYFDYRGLIKESRVIEEEICLPTKMAHKVYELFQVRYKLYKDIYHHRVSNGIELMIADALFNANSHYNFKEIISSPEEYMKLTDYILKEIELSKSPSLEYSRQIVKRIRTRDIYKFVAETIIDVPSKSLDEERMKQDIMSCAKNNGSETALKLESIYVVKGANTYGFKDKNPVDSVNFYNKNNISKKFRIDKEQISLLLPSKFSETFVRVYTSDSDKVEVLKDAFRTYCQKHLNVAAGPVEPKNFADMMFKAKRTMNDDVFGTDVEQSIKQVKTEKNFFSSKKGLGF